jgi:hypothetical protein
MLFGAGVLALVACASKPPRIADARLAGSWRNADGAVLSAEDTGIFTLLRPGARQRPVVGEYTFDGESAIFRFRLESRMCSDDPGQYALAFTDGSFVASVMRDPCAERRALVEGTWTRTEAGRVTPES